MEENKEKKAAAPQETPTDTPTPLPKAQPEAAADDDVATAEEMEAFIRDRREKERHEKREDKVDVFGEYTAPENSIDPYIEPDPTLPWVKYEEGPFLSRGCCRCPDPYLPVTETENRRCSKVTSCNWMRGIRQPGGKPFDCVEVRFKNNRKEFFRLPDGLEVTEGDVVAVEGLPGHDIGIVSLTGEVCRLQMKKRKADPASESIHKLFRRAKSSDIERWAESIREEDKSLIRTRQIASGLGLEMKINDVEIQGDHSKAIFYYTADDRVDFRTLIKMLADEFHVRVEMKQIGVRQEAGKVGGLGTCGRELCCSTWLTNFKSVTTSAAKVQQIVPNPQKLAGQCGKLKCCLNFECETYADALKNFPPAGVSIRFKKGLALYKKTDVFRGIMWYAYEGENELYAIPAESVKQIIEQNRQQQYPEKLEDFQVELMSTAALAQESTSAEYERELSRMSDDTGDSSRSSEPGSDSGGEGRRDRRGGDRPRNGRPDKGDKGDKSSRGERGERGERRDKNERRGGDRPRGGEHRQPKEGDRPKENDRPRSRRSQPRRSGDSDQPRRSGDNNRRS